MATLETLDKAVDAARTTDAAEALISGVMLVRTQLFRILQEEGLERVSVLGLPYDPRSSEVVQRRPVTDPDQDGVVIEELQGGHQLRGHIIRRAKVVVGELSDYSPSPTVVVPAVVRASTPPSAPKAPPSAAAPAGKAAPPEPTFEATAVMPALAPEPPPNRPSPEPKTVPPPPRPPDADRIESTAVMPALADDEDEDRADPTVAMPAYSDPDDTPPLGGGLRMPPAEKTVAMGVDELEAMVKRKKAEAAAKGKAAPAPAAPEPPAEEQIVVEDWAEPTPMGTPGTLVDAAAMASAHDSSGANWDKTQTDAPTRARRPGPPTPPPPPPADADSEDDSANATMVLADSAAIFVRPGAPAPPKARGQAAAPAAASAPAEAEEWESAEQWQGNDPNETQPVPRENRKAGAPPPVPTRAPAPPAAARPRGAPATDAVRRKARAATHEEPPTTPNAPAWRPPAAAPGQSTAARRRASEGHGSGFYAAMAFGFVALAGAVGYGVWKLTHRPPVEIAQTGPVPTTSTTIPEEVQVVRPTTPEEAANQTPPPGEQVTPSTLVPPINTVSTTLPTAGTVPPPTTLAAAPPSTAVHAPPTTLPPVNPVVAALAQADAAMTAHNYNEAIKHFDAALAAEPGNAEATTGKQRAMGERAASLDRYWKTDPTMTEGKASGGGIPGFTDAAVVKTRCDCALQYEISPAKPVQGQPYTVKLNLKNDTKKDIKLRSLEVTVRVNNSGSAKNVPLLANSVERGKTVTVGQVEDTWKLGTTSWSLEGAVADQGGVKYRAQYTWDVR